jgi:hypothetical protein
MIQISIHVLNCRVLMMYRVLPSSPSPTPFTALASYTSLMLPDELDQSAGHTKEWVPTMTIQPVVGFACALVLRLRCFERAAFGQIS